MQEAADGAQQEKAGADMIAKIALSMRRERTMVRAAALGAPGGSEAFAV
jgi:hypothetical protein